MTKDLVSAHRTLFLSTLKKDGFSLSCIELFLGGFHLHVIYVVGDAFVTKFMETNSSRLRFQVNACANGAHQS